MLYQLKQGPTEQKIIKDHLSAGLPIHDKIKNAPVLIPGLGFYYKAFCELDADRPIGFGICKIPWTSKRNYASDYAVDEEQYEDLFFFIDQMDNAYIDYEKAKQKK